MKILQRLTLPLCSLTVTNAADLEVDQKKLEDLTLKFKIPGQQYNLEGFVFFRRAVTKRLIIAIITVPLITFASFIYIQGVYL